MTISHVQSGGTNTDNAQPGTRATASNVTSGNLVVVVAARFSPSNDPFVAGDCTKSAGTSTIGTISLDASANIDTGGGVWGVVGIWSAIVSGTGSLTMSVAGGSTDFWNVAIIELSATSGWDASRLEAQNSNTTATDNSSPATTGNGTSVGGAAFIAGLSVQGSGTITITEDAAFSLAFEEQDASLHNTGSIIYRIVSSGTTDQGEWTLSNNAGWATALAVYKEVSSGSPIDEDYWPSLTKVIVPPLVSLW